MNYVFILGAISGGYLAFATILNWFAKKKKKLVYKTDI